MFQEDDYYYFNGCSFTYGIGIRPWPPSEEMFNLRWSSLVSNHYGVKSYNNSAPGSCNERIFRTTYDDILSCDNKPKMAVIMWSDPPRTELFRPQENELASLDLAQINPQSINGVKSREHVEALQMYYAFIHSEERALIRTLSYMVSLKFLFDSLQIPFIMLHYKSNFYRSYRRIIDKWSKQADEDAKVGSYLNSVKRKVNLLQGGHIFGLEDGFSFDSLLAESNIPLSVYSGGHPDERGHRAMSEWLINYIDSNNVSG